MNEITVDEPQNNLLLLARPFPEKDLDWRIGQSGRTAKGPWAKVLCYIDARAVMDRLDEVVGPGNWKDRYWHEKDGVMCGLSVRVNGEWVEKIDGSDETDVEAFKGGISKALVRAGVKWGIGRYLYQLTENFAKIVEQGGAARYAKDKDGVFYWLPPALPEWAKPEVMNYGQKRISATGKEASGSGPTPQAGAGAAGSASPARSIGAGSGRELSENEAGRAKGGNDNDERPSRENGDGGLHGVRRDSNSGRGIPDQEQGDAGGNRGGNPRGNGKPSGQRAPAKPTAHKGSGGGGDKEPNPGSHPQPPAPATGAGAIPSGPIDGFKDGSGPSDSIPQKRPGGPLVASHELIAGEVRKKIAEAKSLESLAKAWTSSVESMKDLPDEIKKQLVALKDEAKKRFS